MLVTRLVCTLLFASASCSIPGFRPEGRIQSVSGSVPAPSADVLARARGWFDRNGYTISETPRSIGGVKVLQRDGDVVTRARVDFVIRDASEVETRYSTTQRVERGVPPDFEAIDYNGTQPIATTSLDSWLSCGSARWPRCP